MEKIPAAKLRLVAEARKRDGKQPDQAARLYQIAVQLDPQDLSLRLALAHARFTLSNKSKAGETRQHLIQEARRDLNFILQKVPQHTEALKTKALSLGLDPTCIGEDGKVDRRFLPPALRNKDLPPARLLASLAFFSAEEAEKKGKDERCRSLIEAALEMDPSHSPSHAHLAKLYLSEGKLREARASLSEAVRHAGEEEEMLRVHSLVAGPNGKKILRKGEGPWDFIAGKMTEAGHHALAAKAFQKAAESCADPRQKAEWSEQAQLADERAQPYEQDFTKPEAPNPAARVLYAALKKQNVPDAVID
ncbi:MAG TPA: tetratricopeptide repeat protein, partial [bacterium]|nr:tetratricopeptide repeat protein [bacterium]